MLGFPLVTPCVELNSYTYSQIPVAFLLFLPRYLKLGEVMLISPHVPKTPLKYGFGSCPRYVWFV
jgi:hypothetical protein